MDKQLMIDKVFDAVSYSFSRKEIEEMADIELIGLYNSIYNI